MSSLWTPDGEVPVGRPQPPPAASRPSARTPPPDGGRDVPDGDGPTDDEIEQLRQQLANTPAAVIVANHVIGCYELAALHLSLHPPQLGEASLAIDAMGAVVEGLAGRLGDNEPTLRDLLAQVRLAFVQVNAAANG